MKLDNRVRMLALILKRASASRPSGEWSDDDFDVLAKWCGGRSHLQGRRVARRLVVDVDARLRAPRGPLAYARLRGHVRGGYGGVREKLAAGGKPPVAFGPIP